MAVVTAPNAVSDPRAVVIKVQHACIAQAAMRAAAAAVYQARSTHAQTTAGFACRGGDIHLSWRRLHARLA